MPAMPALRRTLCSTDTLEDVLRKFLLTAVIKGHDETVRCVFRHLQALRSVFSVSWIDELETNAVLFAVAFDRSSTLEILREVTFACNYPEVVQHLLGPCSGWCCPSGCLFKASLVGDLEEVKRILSADNSGIYAQPHGPLKSETVLDISAWGATARGHVDVLKELLSYQRKFCSLSTRKELLRGVVDLASMTNNIPLAAEVINHGAAAVDKPEAFRVILVNIGDNQAALDEALSYTRRSLDSTIKHVSLRSRTAVERDPFFIAFSTAVQLRKRRQVGALLEMLSHDESLWRFSNGLPCSITDVFGARSLPILRKILVDAPRPFFNKGECTFAKVLSYRWPWFAGARLLLGAGVLSSWGVKHLCSECAKEDKPSLKEKCQKVIRINLRCPLSQSVEKLPLPGVVKRGLLFK